MAIKKFRPVTPGSRFRSIVKDTVTTRKGPEKSLTEPLHSKGGRNHHGRITVRRRGGGHKRRYRRIDFRRNKIGVAGRVAMNPVDHPLGGGEGKASGGRPPVTPWGRPEGKKTRNPRKESNRLIVRGRKRGKATRS